MADSPRRRYSPSPSPRRMRSRSRSRSPIRHRRGNEEAENPGNTLYVTGLSTRVTEKDLEEHFSREGKVIDCRLVVEPRTRISRGFGFVTMDSLEDAERCIKYLNQSILEGRFITVEKASKLCRGGSVQGLLHPATILGLKAPVKSAPIMAVTGGEVTMTVMVTTAHVVLLDLHLIVKGVCILLGALLFEVVGPEEIVLALLLTLLLMRAQCEAVVAIAPILKDEDKDLALYL